ncbi:hypothetical protein [Sinomonas soli]
MADIRVELDRREVGKLLRHPAVRQMLEARARRVAAAAGPGFAASSRDGTNRAHASVTTATTAAKVREARDAVLARALGAARG